ncbi:hypothetical protein I4U23_030770 [Adineta vaga]|nr:hypothetical protein I4U23_030770 [Adineta vaga]
MFPYLTKAKEQNLSVIILNPNQTHYIEEDNSSSEDLRYFYLSSEPLPQLPIHPIPHLSTSRDHILYIYDEIISKFSPAKRLYFVAHSAGGDHLMYLLRKRQDSILSKLLKIAFIDSTHFLTPSDTNELRNFFQSNAIHFIASNKPMGQIIHNSPNLICPEVSAGHSKHEYTSGSCIDGVFKFFR